MENETINIRPPVWAIFCVVVVAGCFYLAGQYIQKQDLAPITITVTGEGKASAAPDLAELNLGVDTGRQATANEAMASLKKSMDAVLAAVKGAGVADKDISTQNFYLSPVYDYTTNGQVPKGFQATESLDVKVRNLDKVSDVLGAATAAGANQAGNVNFTIDDPETVKGDARQKAIAQAQDKAAILAKNLGKSLGRMRAFSEGGGVVPPIMYDKAMAVGMGGGGVAPEAVSAPLPSGEQDVTVDVSITYELR